MIKPVVRPALLNMIKMMMILCLILGLGMGCSGSKNTQPVADDGFYTEYSAAARSAYSQGNLEEAANYYTLAYKRARMTTQSNAIANAAINLAACRIGLQQYDRAHTLLTEARLELIRQGLPIADVLLLQAKTDYVSGDTAGTQRFLYQLKTDPKSRPAAEHLVQADLLAGRIACDQQNWCTATALLETIQGYAIVHSDKLLQARLASLKGHIAMGKAEYDLAARMFEHQVELLRQSGQFRVLGAALARTADAYLANDKFYQAGDLFYQAARMVLEWGDIMGGEQLAQKALDAAGKTQDLTLEHLARSMLSNINARKKQQEKTFE